MGYILRAPRGTFFFTPSEVVLAPSSSPALGDRAASAAEGRAPHGAAPAPLRLRFVDANLRTEMEGAGRLPGKVNYLLGADRGSWRTDVPTYAAVRYKELYPGVALAYGVEGRYLKGTYTVAPGADPARIRWRYQGADDVRVDGEGHLQIRLSGGARDAATLTERAPVAWQESGGRRVPVSARYVVARDGTIGLALGRYDRRRPLTIDPVLAYSTYLGGLIFDAPWAIAVDGAGGATIAGYTASLDFPTVNPYQPAAGGQGEAFVARFAPDGTPLYSTYLGGNYVDYATDIAVDAAGNAYVTGFTGSTDFPTRNAYQPAYAGGWDAFVTKLNPAGSDLVYSTYLGGSGEENSINAGTPGGIAVDGAGHAYLTGNTQSANFPTLGAFQPTLHGTVDAFISKLAADGASLVYSTYLGGERGDTGWGIAVDGSGNAIVTGDTTSFTFPTANPFQGACAASYAACWDVFVTKLNAAGSALVYSTYLGGNDLEYIDRGFHVAVDAAGRASITGMTGSPNFPIWNAYQEVYGGQIDAFVARFGPGGALVSSTFLGGANSDVGYAVALDRAGVVHVSGLTISDNFPVANPLQATLGGFEDAFVAKFRADGRTLAWSTYLGGSDGREEYGSTGIGVDAAGNVYVTGATEATDFPTVDPYQAAPAGSYDAFLARIEAHCVGGGPAVLSGRVGQEDGGGVGGVTLALAGPAGCGDTTETFTKGAYRFGALADGTYEVTPVKPGCTFSPASQTVTIAGSDVRASFVPSCP